MEPGAGAVQGLADLPYDSGLGSLHFFFFNVVSFSPFVGGAPKVPRRRVCSIGVAAFVCADFVVRHQLLSGQMNRGSSPNVSCLLDGGDRGLRPF